jgi:hypothetical protein
MTADPIASRRFASVDYRPLEIVRWQIEVDELDALFEELIGSVGRGFSFVRRSRF